MKHTLFRIQYKAALNNFYYHLHYHFCFFIGAKNEKPLDLQGVENMERAMGIEPTCEAWEAPILPLNYARRNVG